MDASVYVTLARQSGLMREMQVVAHNVANASTTGFRREGVVFAEYVAAMDDGPSLSMAHATARNIDLMQAEVIPTGGTFDLAIQGEGFFLVATPQGDRLTRAGAFTPDAAGNLVNADGHALLDLGGAPVAVPPGARAVAVAQDGTMSIEGRPVARVGLWQPADPLSLTHEAGTLFAAGAVEPAGGAVILQGHLEGSNVNPVTEIARMIMVQRAYEMGQGFLDREDARARAVIQTLGR
jgi:flagellar basal-body rod protein FlgF